MEWPWCLIQIEGLGNKEFIFKFNQQGSGHKEEVLLKNVSKEALTVNPTPYLLIIFLFLVFDAWTFPTISLTSWFRDRFQYFFSFSSTRCIEIVINNLHLSTCRVNLTLLRFGY